MGVVGGFMFILAQSHTIVNSCRVHLRRIIFETAPQVEDVPVNQATGASQSVTNHPWTRQPLVIGNILATLPYS